MVFDRVRLDWGTGLAYRLRLGEQDGIGGLFVKTAWYNPARAEQQSDSTAYDGRKHTVPDAASRTANRPMGPTPIEAAAADGLWSAIADAGPLLWVGAPLLALLGITATGLLILRRRRAP